MKPATRSAPDIVIFDVDGVLVDASLSYPAVVARSLLWAWTRVLCRIPDSEGFSFRHFAVTKTHPAFNDDYDIAWAAINCAASGNNPSLAESLPSPVQWRTLLEDCTGMDVCGWVRRSFGETVIRKAVRQACEEMYFGCDEYESIGSVPVYTTRRKGFWEEERPLASFNWKEILVPVGIYTGRPVSELRLALKLIGWEDFPPGLMITPESGITKPSPEGLAVLCEKTGTANPLFLGDAESDRQALRAFGKGTFAAVGDFLSDEAVRYSCPADALRSAGIIHPPSGKGSLEIGSRQ